MKSIHAKCVEFSPGEKVDYLVGANIAGLSKVARATFAYGVL